MNIEPPIVALLEAFRGHRHLLITSHARPDGDAIGSVFFVAVFSLAACSGTEIENHSLSLSAASRTEHFSMAATKSKTLPCALQEKHLNAFLARLA